VTRPTRLGLIGGTFDPPHYGHLVAAQEAAWQLELDRVLWVPAAQNPLKQADVMSSADDRCEMVSRAIEGNPLFELSRLDIDRPGPSYTADLLRSLHDDRSGQELFFLVGADILPELHRWREPYEVLRLARLVVVNRPDAPVPDIRQLDETLPGARERVDLVFIPGVSVSARYLRARVAAGQPIKYLTPESVEAYIAARGLYRGEEPVRARRAL
jgi:nicotinate-nucleotide adenylyltransferase